VIETGKPAGGTEDDGPMRIPAMDRRQFLEAVPAAILAGGTGRSARAAESPPIRPDDPTGFLGRRSPVFTRRCVASSSSPLVTQVGLRVLEDGGNAFDAAVAMAGMMAVAEPMMSGLGGDTMILAWSAKEQKVFGLNGSGVALPEASLDTVADRPLMPEHGAESVTIPGAVDGWCRLLERFGTRPLASLWQPAVAAARDGYPVGESIAGMWALAATLTSGGMPTAAADIGRQESQWVEPLSVRYRGRDVLGLPPNSQSIVALMALGILEGYDLAAMGESLRLHHEIEALRLGFEFAIDTVGEPTDGMLEQTRRALSAEGLASRRRRITGRATAPVRVEGGNSADTTFLCAIDPEGNAVSLMMSICGLFGSGLVAGDTGVILNNRASQFSARRGHPNALAPGRRPRHTILPGMVLRDGVPEFVLGCIGLNNHPQGQVQMLVNTLDLGMNPQQAVDAARFRIVMTTDEVQLDHRIPEQVAFDLAAHGHKLGDPTAFKGACQMVRIHRGEAGVGPCLESGVDHRLDGVALGR
jgi:gamma-glutamyltranspeptidase/glutathione hydrolase